MNPDRTRTVCEFCKITDEGIVCEPEIHGTRLFIEMTDEEVRDFAREIFRLRALLAEEGPHREFPPEAWEELCALESKIVMHTSTAEDETRYGVLAKMHERYRRPEFQQRLLLKWSEVHALVVDFALEEMQRDGA